MVASSFGTHLALSIGMANKSLADRVTALEEQMGTKTLEQHFREQAELIDRRFIEVNLRFTAGEAQFTAIYARFTAIDKRFDAVDARLTAMDERFSRLEYEISGLRKDVAIVQDGIGAILKRFDAIHPAA